MSRHERLCAAVAVAERGWRVFPLVPGRKTPRKAAVDWERRATSDPARIRRWWGRHPADNIGIAAGPSGLVVIDLDVPKPDEPPRHPDWPGCACGLDVLATLAERHGQTLEPTYTVATATGGRHLYYRAPQDARLRNTRGDTPGGLGWKIDTRAQGGYVVAAGSVVDHRPYSVLDARPPALLPGWLTRLLTPPSPAAPTPPPVRVSGDARRRAYARAALEGEVQRVLDARAGTRNWALNTAAWNLSRLVADGLLDRNEVEDALCHAGVSAGYRDGPRAVAAVVRCALDARLRRSGSGERTPPAARPAAHHLRPERSTP